MEPQSGRRQEEAVSKQRLPCKMQSAQRLINIKIAKAYRTISYEACVMAGVLPIGTVIAGNVQLYKRKHGLQCSEHQYDMPLPVTE
jgi:hypothetical protein